ncbi:MAG TPA: hypothetical protein HA258_03840 [Thermoplasmata archaeon]|nr:hypothetical protein [Thermoplasmata archaeon]
MNISRKILGIIICMLMCTVSYPLVGANILFDDLATHHVLVRVTTGVDTPVLPKNIEIAQDNPGAWVDIIIPPNRLQELSELNLPYSIIIENLEEYDASLAGSYHTLVQIQAILEGIASNYPDITKLYSIGTTYEGRDIWCLEVSDNPGVNEGEPGVFFMGLHHAREWPTVEICLHIANNLTSLYGSNSTIADLVDNRRVWIVPVTNPDGYYYCHDQGVDWRKNRHFFPQYNSYGVDTNRNYNGSSDGNIMGSWGSILSWANSHNSDNECYSGPGPTSESENQAVARMFLDNDICATITYHTYGETVMWPWGYTGGQTPDNTYLSSVGQQVAQRIKVQSGSGSYDPHQSYGLYPTVGDMIDSTYGYSHYVQGKATFVYCIEACNEFHPAANYLDQITKENCEGALYLLEEAQNIRDTVVPRVIPPVISSMTNDSDGNYRISWILQNQNADPDYFQLSEMQNLTLVTDDAESGTGLWRLEGFTSTTSRYHSEGHSFKARNADYDASAMTTQTPVFITPGMMLSFWCWYALQQNYDFAYVEVSENGRSYQLFDSFTGSSGAWVQKQYSLENFTGKSLFIRFRFGTDAAGHQEGFYVDDISPIGIFGSSTILSSSIVNTYYDIVNEPLGTYYYCVRGHNSVRGWGENSTLQVINVTQGGGENHPIISLGNFTASPGKISMTVKNIGDANATKVNVTLEVHGGMFGMISSKRTATFPMLSIGQERLLTTDKFLLGFGKITLTASAECDQAVPPEVSANATAKIFLIFVTL